MTDLTQLLAQNAAGQPGAADRLLDEVWSWAARADSPEGGKMLDREWVQTNLARVYAKLEALKLLNWRSA